ncbi:MAG: hypothetical protein J5795_04610 [Lachnospiraceae bacterium]|nr:hypothetical protein [Lachnospiraceae bacterium]
MLLWEGHTKSNPAAVWCEKSKRIGTKRKLSAIWYHRKASVLAPNGSYQQFGTIEKHVIWYETEETSIWYQKNPRELVPNRRIFYLVPKRDKKYGTKRKISKGWYQNRSKKVEPDRRKRKFGGMPDPKARYQTEATCNLVPWKASTLVPNGSNPQFGPMEKQAYRDQTGTKRKKENRPVCVISLTRTGRFYE